MQAVFPSAIPSLTVGGRTFTDLANLIILGGNGSGSTVSCARKANGSAGYTPSGSKAFQVSLVELNLVSSSEGDFCLLYADNDLGFDSGGAFTNPKYEYKNSAATSAFRVAAGSGIVQYFFPTQFQLPNAKFLYLTEAGGTDVYFYRVYGYEV